MSLAPLHRMGNPFAGKNVCRAQSGGRSQFTSAFPDLEDSLQWFQSRWHNNLKKEPQEPHLLAAPPPCGGASPLFSATPEPQGSRPSSAVLGGIGQKDVLGLPGAIDPSRGRPTHGKRWITSQAPVAK